jgi:hypothetical protein
MKSHSRKIFHNGTGYVCLAVLCLTGTELCRGEVNMIYPVPSVSGENMAKPDQMLEYYSKVGRGQYEPLKLKDYTDKRELKFRTSFEECAPMRNSAANEWSAFGVMGGNKDFNAMGRDMWVRYPAFELVFRLYKDGKEVKPDSLDSFRLGLVNNRLPAIWGAWQDNGLSYKVSVMTVPSPENGNYDLYKLEIQNPTDKPVNSDLVVGLDGSPDLRLEDGVVRGLGDAAFLIVDPPGETEMFLRDYGLCDKRAKGYWATRRDEVKKGWDCPGIQSYRLGFDGLPVVYRFKAEKGAKYHVYLSMPIDVQSPKAYYLPIPQEIGDQILELQVEGCPTQTVDAIEHLQKRDNKVSKNLYRAQFMGAGFHGATDQNGDGYIEVRSGVSANSKKCHYSVLGMIYVFSENTQIENNAKVLSGEMNSQCVWRIDVGATPEQWWNNQKYDVGDNQKYGASDVGLARLKLNYTGTVAPGEIKTYWLKVPPIHRREPVSMHYIAHAFREVLPGEAIPPFGDDKVASLKKADPKKDEQRTVKYWDDFFAKAAQFDLPDPVLTDIFLSRLATRAILDIKINDRLWCNACSPFFYFDFAYRDHCYHVVARDMAGMTGEAAKLANTYCVDADDAQEKGPIWFTGEPLQLGMQEDGLWLTRPGQYDTLGQNLWGLVVHYKYTGDRDWLEKTAWPYIRRGAMWIVNSRHKHMKDIGDPSDMRYGLIEPGAMEVGRLGKGVHMYYMDAFAVLGLKETADAALALGKQDDYTMFYQEYQDLKKALYRAFQYNFKRTGLYEGNLWYGVEQEPGDAGMYGDWAHNALVWPCGAIDPQDPMWTATLRKMDYESQTSGAGMHVGWPYIGTDRAISYLLRGEPEKTFDYFCAYTDTAGGTFSWGEGYSEILCAGDQPHNWADTMWVILFRNLFAFEGGDTLHLTPAIFRRWMQGDKPIIAKGLPTHFGVLDLKVQPSTDGKTIDYTFSIEPNGDQGKRKLAKIIVSPRAATGCAIQDVQMNGKAVDSFTRDQIILSKPKRNQTIKVHVNVSQIF